MNYTVTYKRHVCKVFFINNMSGWHFSCQPHYNEAWIQETGPLTEEETNALEAFADIARQYGYESGKWLGRPVVAASSEEQALLDVENLIGGTNAGTLRDVFRVMEPRFAKIWARDEERLTALAERLRGKLLSEGMARAVEVAERLYGTRLSDLEILLTLSRGRSINGGATSSIATTGRDMGFGTTTPNVTGRGRPWTRGRRSLPSSVSTSAVERSG